MLSVFLSSNLPAPFPTVVLCQFRVRHHMDFSLHTCSWPTGFIPDAVRFRRFGATNADLIWGAHIALHQPNGSSGATHAEHFTFSLTARRAGCHRLSPSGHKRMDLRRDHALLDHFPIFYYGRINPHPPKSVVSSSHLDDCFELFHYRRW